MLMVRGSHLITEAKTDKDGVTRISTGAEECNTRDISLLNREDNRPREDMTILNRACRYFGKPVGTSVYAGITLHEAQAMIGYPDVKLDIKG